MWQAVKYTAGEICRGWGKYECTTIAAAVAFYAALSLFPLMLVLVAGVGFFFRFMEGGKSALDQILSTVSEWHSPTVGSALERVLSQMQDKALVNGPLAGLALLLTATLVFAQVDRGFMRIWDVRERSSQRGLWVSVKWMLLTRARSLALLIGTFLLVMLVFVAGLALRAVTGITREWFPEVPTISGLGTLLVGAAVNVLVFFLLYRFLSKEQTKWSLCLRAGVVAAALWEGGSRLLTQLSFGASYSAYGLIGSFLVVQVWIYYNVMVLFIGALVVRVGTRPLEGLEDGR